LCSNNLLEARLRQLVALRLGWPVSRASSAASSLWGQCLGVDPDHAAILFTPTPLGTMERDRLAQRKIAANISVETVAR